MSAFTTQAWDTSRRSCVRVEFESDRPECRALQIESTPKGRKVRVYMEPNEDTDGAWQSITVVLPDGGTVEIRGTDFYGVQVRRADGSFVGWLDTNPPEPEREP